MLSVKETFKHYKVKLPDDNLKYKILSVSDILDKEIGSLVDKSMEIFDSENVSPQDCQKLLYEFKWDYDRMLQKFLEADSFDAFLRNNNIDLTIPLPSQMMIDAFMSAKPLYKWCPNKQNGCKKAVKIDTSDVKDIACECGIEYCSKCLGSPHSPFPCVLLQEWVIQRDEFAHILEQNNVICPKCRQFYPSTKLYGELICLCCSYSFLAGLNKLTRWNYPDYNLYLYDAEYLEEIATVARSTEWNKKCSIFHFPFFLVFEARPLPRTMEKFFTNARREQKMGNGKWNIFCSILSTAPQYKKDALIGVENVEFTSTVYKVTLNLLQQWLSIHAFSFYLDKEYLEKNPLILMFDFHREKLASLFKDLKNEIRCRISDKTLELLHSLQQHLDILLEFINKTHGWIFKLPEIQQAYPDGDHEDNDEEDLIDDEVEDAEDLIDEEEDMEEISVVASDDEDMEEEADDEEESFVDVCV